MGTSVRDIPNPKPPSLTELANEIAKRAQFAPRELRFSSKADLIWAEHYIERRKQRRRNPENEFENELTARSDLHAKKIALLFAALNGRAEIEIEDVLTGIEIGNYCDQAARFLVRTVLSNREDETEKRIRGILIQEKRISTRDLSRKSHLKVEELIRILTAMNRLGLVSIQHEPQMSGQTRQMITWLP